MFAMCGKFFVSATFTMMWVYTTEIYPTSVRSIGMTTSSMFARIASVPASYLGLLVCQFVDDLILDNKMSSAFIFNNIIA